MNLKRYVGYCRQSYEDKRKNSLSIEYQKDRIAEWVKGRGGLLARFYVDPDTSAVDYKKREAYKELKEALSKDIFDIIVILNYRRISRDLFDFMQFAHQFEKFGKDVVSIEESFDTSTPWGKAFRDTTIRWGQAEREIRSIEAKAIRKKMIEDGKFPGGNIPYGIDYDKSKKVKEENEEQAKWVRQVFNWTLEGKAIRWQVKELNNLGVKSKRGGKFYDMLLHSIIRNYDYAKLGIISEDIFMKVQERIKPYAPLRKYDYLLSGLLFCECGSPMVGKRKKKPSRRDPDKIQIDYICRRAQTRKEVRKGVCKSPRKIIKADKLEEMVICQAEKIFDARNKEIIMKEYEEYVESISNERQIDLLKKEYDDLKKRIERLLIAYEKADISLSILNERIKKYKNRMEDIDNQLSLAKQSSVLDKDILLEILDSFSDIRHLDFKDRKELLQNIIRRIIVRKQIVEIEYFFKSTDIIEIPLKISQMNRYSKKGVKTEKIFGEWQKKRRDGKVYYKWRKLQMEHYVTNGAHIYIFSGKEKGDSRGVVAFEYENKKDGRMLFQESGGLKAYEEFFKR